jgi:hypothetical protein
MVQGGKQGLIYLLNRDSMGHFTIAADNIVQEFQADNGSWTTPAFWQNALYIAGSGDHGNCDSLHMYTFTSSSSAFTTAPSLVFIALFSVPGSDACSFFVGRFEWNRVGCRRGLLRDRCKPVCRARNPVRLRRH